ncbi:MAG: hypothetical protein E7612_06060 [Ruminococcaceae bacterium]|jgi:hypothetical protein|nr:hypothetical protein [Oscillospiraceae bacterium]
MNENNEIMNEELALIEVDSIGETLSTIIEQGTEMVMDFFDHSKIAVIYDAVTEISAEMIKASKIITVIKQAASIPDKFFMNKMEKYCRGMVKISENKRKKYAAKVGKAGLNKDSVFILGILNKIEELSKINIMINLFEHKMDEMIDDETYRRLMIIVDRTMFSDLLYLKSNITEEPIVISNDAEQGLLSNGWLSYYGQTWGTATEDSQLLYTYTNIAKQFCKLITI